MLNRPEEEMHCRTKACPGLKRPSVTCFFKVIFGDRFSEVLFLPSKVVPDMLELVDQEVTLQDYTGQQWEVTLTNVEGSLAFQQGWDTFSLDHDLKTGDFLVFKYKKMSHFVVKIYSKSQCEKLDFPKRQNRWKRASDSEYSFSKDGRCQIDHESSMSKQSSRTSSLPGSDMDISKGLHKMNDTEDRSTFAHNTSDLIKCNRTGHVSDDEHFDETCYVLNRDLGYKQGQEERPAFDLSIFEMSKMYNRGDKNGTTLSDERFTDHFDPSPMSNGDAGLIDDNIATTKQVERAVPSGPSNFEMIEKGHCPEVMNKRPSYSDKDYCPELTSGHLLQIPDVHPKENAAKIYEVSAKVINKHQTAERSGTTMQTIKKEPVEIASNAGSQKIIKEISGEFSNAEVTKNQSSNLVGISSPAPSSISCLVAKRSRSFLELPACLPLSSSRKWSFKMERKVVLLRDQVMRLWPVLYHETPSFNTLTAGWNAFSAANNILLGDECTFEVENESEGIYRVHLNQR